MDRANLEDGLRQANARVVAGNQALMEQRGQIRELERWGLDASVAKALLRIYDESHAMSILDRRRLYRALARATANEPLPVQDNDHEYLPADYAPYRKAA